MLTPIVNFLTEIFNGLHSFVLNVGVTHKGTSYVLAIFLLTLLVRLILLPLNIKQINSQAKMQEIQPQIKELQTKYKNDPQKSQAEMMKLYKENNVNPFSGCLPLIIQMPILFALYYVFMGINVEGASFLWIKDLYAPDKFYILPILSAATTYLSSYLMTKNSNNTGQENTGMNMGSMNIGMAIMMGFFAINFRSALVLYWIMGNLIQVAQTYFLVVIPAKKKALEA
ncbi:membrane protein insertase YidC [Clostridium polyendosporum]|uniref:Membrane protein insertase YidC n=1 Tax=Clostridium polyendosporum TaxID=69208 RepID=A0A919VG16_9CLOT|nr:membrane protein insertase YidC [Clostridium polyendosporum]GIM28980.1 membrane protein insertase YidC [Clostridium polyendosporum]